MDTAVTDDGVSVGEAGCVASKPDRHSSVSASPLVLSHNPTYGKSRRAAANRLDTKLRQVVVDVFVHKNRPLMRFERSKERVRMS